MTKSYHPVQMPLFDASNVCTHKRCSVCFELKPLADFYPHSHCPLGVMPQCKPCYTARQRNIEYRRPDTCIACGEADLTKFYYNQFGLRHKKCKLCENKSKTRFGLTLEFREKMLQDQGGVCAICGKPETEKHQNGTLKNLAIDHDHKTGRVRGLLCAHCNHMLGEVHDDPAILRKAIAYLKKHR